MKKLFVSIAAIALTTGSLVPKPALAGQPNMQYVGSAESGDVYLLDYNSLRRNGAIIQYNTIERFNSTHYDDQDRPLVGMFQSIRGSCSTGKIQSMGSANYGSGWVVTQSYNGTTPVIQLDRGTVAAMVLAAACQATN